MYQSIVVPVDGTQLAESALPLARQLARRAHARVHLVLSHRAVPVMVGGGEIVMPTDQLDVAVRDQEHAYLEATAGRLERAGFRGVEALQTDGPPGPAVCDEIKRIRADLVVMASHGRGALGRLWRGSVADYLIHRCGVPVLLIGPGIEDTGLGVGGRILLAVDLTPESETLLAPAAAMARLLGAHVTLLHVSVLPRQPGGEVSPQTRLDRMAEQIRALGCSASTRVVTDLTASAGILGELADERYAMAVVSPHKNGKVRELFLGSTAHSVIRVARVPVLVVGPGGAAVPS